MKWDGLRGRLSTFTQHGTLFHAAMAHPYVQAPWHKDK
jgi:hypothetical protein